MKNKISYLLLAITSIYASCKHEAKNTGVKKADNADAFIMLNKTGNDSVFYDNTKQLRFAGELIKGKRNGLWKAYYKNGSLWSEGEFKNGLGEGYSHVYHTNGKVSTMGFYTNDNPSGVWQYFNEQGTMTHEIDYTQGRKGKLTTYTK